MTNWVSIEREKCKECGLCLSICMRCFSKKDGRTEVSADKDNCNLCGHCAAICPAGAIVHHKMSMEAFTEHGSRGRIEPEPFIAFLKRRRSHRNFLEREVPREVLESLLDVCRFAPTGSNVQNVGVLVIRDRRKIERLADLTIDFYRQAIARVQRTVEELRAQAKTVPPDLAYAYERSKRYAGHVKNREEGGDPIFRHAPAVLIFHSTPYTSTPKDNCVIAAHTLALTAMTMGLETCYVGLFERAFKDYPPVGKELNLPEGHEAYSVLVLGYPKVKFLRAVDRKPLSVRWA